MIGCVRGSPSTRAPCRSACCYAAVSDLCFFPSPSDFPLFLLFARFSSGRPCPPPPPPSLPREFRFAGRFACFHSHMFSFPSDLLRIARAFVAQGGCAYVNLQDELISSRSIFEQRSGLVPDNKRDLKPDGTCPLR